MAKIYISPSTQEHNVYTGGGNEEEQMRKLCTKLCSLLISAGHQVKMGGTIDWQHNAADANTWGAEWYVAVHSNAGGGHGTVVFYYTGSTKGKELAAHILKYMGPASNEPESNPLRSNTTFGELRVPKAPASLVEVAFHDNLKEATEIKNSLNEFALAICKGILEVAGGYLPNPINLPDWFISSQNDNLIVMKPKIVKNTKAWKITAQTTAILILRR